MGFTSYWGVVHYLYNSGRTDTDEGLISSPTNSVRSGYVGGTHYLRGAGYNGIYWSSTVSSSSQAYRFDSDSSWISLAGLLGRYNDLSVRCIAR